MCPDSVISVEDKCQVAVPLVLPRGPWASRPVGPPVGTKHISRMLWACVPRRGLRRRGVEIRQVFLVVLRLVL